MTPGSDLPPTPVPSQRFPSFLEQREGTGVPMHKHRQETAQDVREGRMEQSGGPKALTMGIWTGLRDRAHSRVGAEPGRQARGGS